MFFNVIRTVLVLSLLPTVMVHALRGHQGEEQDPSVAPVPQTVNVNLDLDALTEEQQSTFLRIMAIGEVPEDVDVTTLPQACQALVAQRLQGTPVTLAVGDGDLQAPLEATLAEYKLAHVQEQWSRTAQAEATAGLQALFEALLQKAATAHGALTAATEAGYIQTLDTEAVDWLTGQYTRRNEIGAALQVHAEREAAMDVEVPEDVAEEEPQEEEVELDFTPVDVATRLQEDLVLWASDAPLQGPLANSVGIVMGMIPDASDPFQLHFSKAAMTAYSLLLSNSFGTHYLAFLDENVPEDDA